MELNPPRPKKYCRLPPNLQVPVILKRDDTLVKFKGNFNGFSVVIENEEDMKNVISMGYFGKANFSRSYPQFSQNKTEIIRDRQYERRKDWAKSCPGTKHAKKVIVVPDSDEETEDYFTNLKPEYQIDASSLKETVWLSLEESFFLTNAINCLDIYQEKKLLSPGESWKLFAETDSHFMQSYIPYYYYRMKNWVVKPGIKFGGDFLLYKQGPPFYHASYVVIIDSVDANLKRIESLSKRSMDNVSLTSLNRLCETAGKELLICQIVWPQNSQIDYNNFSNFIIKEILMRRWISTQERNTEDV
ncbi:hypothetical protein NQ314_016041 [Rhamnusium bicolor]|uniref:tRNA-splicing endonuclease subunit Sen2 n=1 Tax=Rhamnusium bicolor TaxID=1586634 RepID=A0AAV8WZP2_9CUCU|nr:hypothetical protein NQ314_016041 [Rhamnusium bicolor]